MGKYIYMDDTTGASPTTYRDITQSEQLICTGDHFRFRLIEIMLYYQLYNIIH